MTVIQPEAEGTSDGIALSYQGPLAEVILDRPAVHNALNLAMWRQLTSVLCTLADEANLRVVILRGAGEQAFSAGADIGEFRAARVGTDVAASYNAAVSAALEAVRDIPVPVIAMIGGLAVGGGCEIATACDLRIASERARFGIPIMHLGVTLGYAEASALVGLVGAGHAKDLLLTGRIIDAAEALRIGLVNRVVPANELEQVTRDTAERISKGAPLAARVNKLTINGLVHGLSDAGRARIDHLTAAVYDSEDLLEGIAAFMDKRDPLFKGM
jgi:enoyl-CoA hydratase